MVLLAFNCPPSQFANVAAEWKPGGISTGTSTTVVELWEGGSREAVLGAAPRPIGSPTIWARSAGSEGGATSGAEGAADGRHGMARMAGTQTRIPPRPLAGSFVNPALYLAFSTSGSTFQRWPGAW